MFNAFNTKLLLVIVALLATIVSYLGYEKHQEDVARKRAEQLFRPPRPDEKQAIDGLNTWGKKAREYHPK